MGLISMNVEEKENMLSLSVWTKLVRVILMIQFNTSSIVQLCVIAIGKASDVANKWEIECSLAIAQCEWA